MSIIGSSQSEFILYHQIQNILIGKYLFFVPSFFHQSGKVGIMRQTTSMIEQCSDSCLFIRKFWKPIGYFLIQHNIVLLYQSQNSCTSQNFTNRCYMNWSSSINFFARSDIRISFVIFINDTPIFYNNKCAAVKWRIDVFIVEGIYIMSFFSNIFFSYLSHFYRKSRSYMQTVIWISLIITDRCPIRFRTGKVE